MAWAWATALWGFCRAYYFAFYVIEKYVDPGYQFSGLASVIRSCLRIGARAEGGEWWG